MTEGAGVRGGSAGGAAELAELEDDLRVLRAGAGRGEQSLNRLFGEVREQCCPSWTGIGSTGSA